MSEIRFCNLRNIGLVGHSTDFVTKSVESQAEAIVMQHPGWALVIVGVLIAVVGLVRYFTK
jgi:hypothetical protein